MLTIFGFDIDSYFFIIGVLLFIALTVLSLSLDFGKIGVGIAFLIMVATIPIGLYYEDKVVTYFEDDTNYEIASTSKGLNLPDKQAVVFDSDKKTYNLTWINEDGVQVIRKDIPQDNVKILNTPNPETLSIETKIIATKGIGEDIILKRAINENKDKVIKEYYTIK